ncbi:alpha/beta fold hydrolase [Roseinatronobacter alkalisoli]|uniref:Alpha/beta fold hydrolase n=1 Tax=Roseinatronobacter alkalisoli TaxID=3028235 RepID=A0ABT5T722_9RHOB|nr:alpha/beta fold hydrolase [Roseinatronobacter sp. HJB301]MDD7970744.1 alpha/beta fold hydrolase [Roseinatronobacter sp. HJB301]
MLNILRNGTRSELPPLLIVHGLFGSARNWGAIAKRLSDSREVISVDMRNHGDSPWADSHGYDDLAADLAQVITSQNEPMDVLGHSMGGKAAMMLALTRPELVNRLLVADIAPVAYEHSQTHLIAAMRALDISALKTRADADAALSADVADPGVRAFLLQSLDLRADPPRWRLNLDVLEREMDRITGWPDDVQGSYDRPVLFLSGAKSDYVLPGHRPAIKALFPDAKFAKLPGAGHWLHAEAPRPFEASVRMWFD